jgi:hypothetical protein
VSQANDLTDADLARGRELLTAATPGVWGKVVGDTPEIGAYVMGTGVGYQVITNTDREYGAPVMDEADADLIVWMHDAVPRLLALVAAQAEQIDRERAHIAELLADLEKGNACGAVGCRALRDRDTAMAAVERVRALCDEGDGPHGDYSVRTYELRAALDGVE